MCKMVHIKARALEGITVTDPYFLLLTTEVLQKILCIEDLLSNRYPVHKSGNPQNLSLEGGEE